MHDKVAEFVCDIHPTLFGRLACVQKDERDTVLPKGESVDLMAFLDERENPCSMRFQQVNGVAYRLLT
jgi:hypothetical protein